MRLRAPGFPCPARQPSRDDPRPMDEKLPVPCEHCHGTGHSGRTGMPGVRRQGPPRGGGGKATAEQTAQSAAATTATLASRRNCIEPAAVKLQITPVAAPLALLSRPGPGECLLHELLVVDAQGRDKVVVVSPDLLRDGASKPAVLARNLVGDVHGRHSRAFVLFR